ncbi:MAG: aminotransferase class I/II-fold pyridoxal phosphate-dependent enzyme [Deltaproteobacteria bacterium]|nr:aminotransferase class I/II-fold pyridoxal phosphate-dependent enzyme [Candidatus Tharpella aukensis]
MSIKNRESIKAQLFGESVIRGMTRLCREYDGVNLSQGFPDFPAPELIKEAACKAVMADVNQYAITWGSASLRAAIVKKMRDFYDLEIDGETEITVTCGATEAMISALLAVVNPGDEVIIFAPFYENYGPDAIICGAVPRYVQLNAPDWSFDRAELEAAFTEKTRAIIINTPHNPTGKVFSRAELEVIAELCCQHDVLAITDEIYEHILYDGTQHLPLATLPGMAERTITINGISKTYSVTGWRIGYCLAAPEITAGIRKIHDFLTVGAPAPLQEAAAVMMGCDDNYYFDLANFYQHKRDFLLEVLTAAGFRCQVPQGAYYIMADFRNLSELGDLDFAHYLVKEKGLANVPGSSFLPPGEPDSGQVRFCFCKTDATLQAAAKRLHQL